MTVGKVQKVDLRTAFVHEAYNFSRWLEANIDALTQPLGIELTVLEREKTVGSFSVDLFCQDSDGEYVIIENQLGRTDHDHLGKMLTYLVNLEAKTAIWVTSNPRPEHQKVIDWLNESTSTEYSFFLVQVEAIRIGDSPAAPLFTVISRPDEQIKEIGETKKELADRHIQRHAFWTQLLERSKGRTTLFASVAPRTDHWLSTGSGRSGITFNYLVLKDGAGITLNIDVGDQQRNKAIFEELSAQRAEIEHEFGDSLNWQRLDDKRASLIKWRDSEHGSLNEPDKWADLQDLLIEKMIRFDRALRGRIARLRAN